MAYHAIVTANNRPQVGRNLNRGAAFAVVAVAYLIALAAAVAAGWTVRDWHPLAVVAVADLTGTIVIFAASVTMRNSSM